MFNCMTKLQCVTNRYPNLYKHYHLVLILHVKLLVGLLAKSLLVPKAGAVEAYFTGISQFNSSPGPFRYAAYGPYGLGPWTWTIFRRKDPDLR